MELAPAAPQRVVAVVGGRRRRGQHRQERIHQSRPHVPLDLLQRLREGIPVLLDPYSQIVGRHAAPTLTALERVEQTDVGVESGWDDEPDVVPCRHRLHDPLRMIDTGSRVQTPEGHSRHDTMLPGGSHRRCS